MTTTSHPGGWRCIVARPLICLLALATVAGCSFQGRNQAVMDSLAEMEIRIRLLQSEVTDVRQAIAARETAREARGSTDVTLQAQLDDMQRRLASLPEQLAELCPEPPQYGAMSAQCEGDPEIQRVVVSGDKLVVGEVERVWLEPPSAFMEARIDAAAERSLLRAQEVVEFERDGNKWIRFEITAADEAVSIERPLQRTVRVGEQRRPVVTLRVQLGDVRESVEFALTDLSGEDQPMVLGRNFLTDVALLDVARKFVQRTSTSPNG